MLARVCGLLRQLGMNIWRRGDDDRLNLVILQNALSGCRKTAAMLLGKRLPQRLVAAVNCDQTPAWDIALKQMICVPGAVNAQT